MLFISYGHEPSLPYICNTLKKFDGVRPAFSSKTPFAEPPERNTPQNIELRVNIHKYV